jgi:hypothetical protein
VYWNDKIKVAEVNPACITGGNINCTIFRCKTLRKETDWLTGYSRIILKQIVWKWYVRRYSGFRRLRK